jgi:hypothetical protein
MGKAIQRFARIAVAEIAGEDQILEAFFERSLGDIQVARFV